jgi:hypothetical protein
VNVRSSRPWLVSLLGAVLACESDALPSERSQNAGAGGVATAGSGMGDGAGVSGGPATSGGLGPVGGSAGKPASAGANGSGAGTGSGPTAGAGTGGDEIEGDAGAGGSGIEPRHPIKVVPVDGAAASTSFSTET